AEVIARHQAATWQVAFAGFAPGFGYLAGDDGLFDVPRRSSPRTRVPVGAVALAGEFTGVYPRSSPGGWQLIGRTEARLWDLDRQPPALFVPGTIVRFVEAERESVDLGAGADDASASAAASAAAEAPAASSAEAGWSGEAGDAASAPGDATRAAGHGVEVVRAGLQRLIEGLGRPGFNSMGVSGAGAADRTALRRANRLVGNAESAAGLESFGGGAVLAVI